MKNTGSFHFLNERFPKGEISIPEYDEMISLLEDKTE
jgi:uncharacterized membrane protein